MAWTEERKWRKQVDHVKLTISIAHDNDIDVEDLEAKAEEFVSYLSRSTKNRDGNQTDMYDGEEDEE